MHLEHFEVAHCHLLAAHAACHAHTFGNTTACATATADRARLALAVLLTVSAGTAVEAVALNNTLKALCLLKLKSLKPGRQGQIPKHQA